MQLKMVILTKSDKHNEYCVAGRDILTGNWIRLVNADDVMTDYDLTTQTNYICQELDVVEVDVLDEPSIVEHQPENKRIDESVYIKKIGRMTWNEVIAKWGVDSGKTILGIPSKYGSVDIDYRLDYYRKNGFQNRSLSIIEVSDIEFISNVDSNGNLKRHPKIKFIYNKVKSYSREYCFTLTDPSFPNSEGLIGTHTGPVYLIVSLGEIYKDRVYLLGAKIISID